MAIFYIGGNILSANDGPPSYAGTIIKWTGSIANIPLGFQLCDGTNGTDDLRDKFIVGASQDNAGVADTTITGAPTKSGGSTQHNHTYSGVTGVPSAATNVLNTAGVTPVASRLHTHTYSGTVDNNVAGTIVVPYYALCFIQRL